jgi:hypothetical protein
VTGVPLTFTVRPSKFEQPQPVMSVDTRRQKGPVVPNAPDVPFFPSTTGLHGMSLGSLLDPALPIAPDWPALAAAPALLKELAPPSLLAKLAPALLAKLAPPSLLAKLAPALLKELAPALLAELAPPSLLPLPAPPKLFARPAPLADAESPPLAPKKSTGRLLPQPALKPTPRAEIIAISLRFSIKSYGGLGSHGVVSE